MSRTIITCGVAIWLVMTLLSGAAIYYHGQYQDEVDRANESEHSLKLAKENITDMHTRQRDVAALDAKYTQELSDAKANIDQLERDVAAGKRRLQLNAKCKNDTTGTGSVDDAISARLTKAAQRNYFILRERVEIIGKQIAGL